MSNQLISVVVDVFQDALSMMGLPASSLGSMFKAYFEGKMKEARDELVAAIQDGKVGPGDAANKDQTIAVIYRYFVAARDGTARRNLRLMAKAVVGLLKEDRLSVDEFTRFAPILSELTERQMIVAVPFCQSFDELMAHENDQAKASMNAFTQIIKELVPEKLPDEQEVKAVLWEITGRGLVTAEFLGGTNFTPTRLLRDLLGYVEDETNTIRESEIGTNPTH